ncbi:hypothetical protein ABPG77_002702 [Micractinium sp. CCAP 211/92]
MGCSSSKPVADDSAIMRRRARGSMAMVGLKTEVAKDAAQAAEATRVDATNGSVALRLPPGTGLGVRYAYISQRGYYPDAPDKTNQDGVSATERLGGQPDLHLFSVYDGHGELGTECAQFVRDRLAANVSGQPSFPAAPAAALSSALILANEQLHDSPIDDCLSGTTACCALLAGRTLHVANVGDSRAVLCCATPGGLLLARDLSQDQTPFRCDECLRVLKAGARVMTLDQLEGLKDPALPCWTSEEDCDGDPPRLWSPCGLFPGTAFTRSIGDTAAEDIGVIPDPEMTATQLGPQHRFAILASDGIWEFISSQQAVDMVARHDNPYDAAKALVAQAYKLWLQKETRTDDITCVVIFFDHEQDASDMSGGNTTAAAGAAAQEPTQSTPPQAVEPSSRLALLRTPSSKQAGAGDAEAVPVAITASDGS